MKIAVFAKKRTTLDGKKTFYNFLATLHRKSDGESVTMQLRFREGCESLKPEDCPCYIEIEKGKVNVQERTFTAKNGEPAKAYTMWISRYHKGEPYEDDSLDYYE